MQVSDPLRRRNFRASDGAALVAAFLTSRQSRQSFCASRGICVAQLAYWLRRERDADPVRTGTLVPASFVEVRGPVSASLTVSVGAAQVAVSAGFDAALLRAVVRALA